MAWYDFLDPVDLFGVQQNRRVKTANDAITNASNRADEGSVKNRALYGQFHDQVSDTYGDTAGKFEDYLRALEDTEAYDPGTFEAQGSVEDFYSKAADLRSRNAMNALRESSDIFSSDYQDSMAAKQQAMASEEWDKAYERYMRDRGQQSSEWQMNANAGQQAYTNQFDLNSNLMGVAQGAQDNLMNSYGNYINNMANQNNIDTQNYSNMVQQQAANENSRKGLLGRILG